MRAQKFDDLQSVADMVIEFRNGFHPLRHQLTAGFLFPRHLENQTARKQSRETVAEDKHVQPGQTFLQQKPVKNNPYQGNNHKDEQREQASTTKPQWFNRKFILSHSNLILEQTAVRNRNWIRLCYSTVTDLARLRGWSTSHPRRTAM